MRGHIDDETARLLAEPRPRILRVADLEPGVFGVLEAEVQQVAPTRTFQRKRGGEGSLCRVTLHDGTGDIDLVLWDDEIRLTRDGPLQPGHHVRLRGATVKSGYRGGVELGLGAAVVEDVTADTTEQLRGTLESLADTQVVDDARGPRFKAEAVLRLDASADDGAAEGEAPDLAHVVLWDEHVRALQGRVGEQVTLLARPHPALDGWWIAGGPPLP